MFNYFFANINKNLLFEKNDFLLLAISGGVDSVVLADLLHKGNFKWAMAHCNFSLRGKDADEDEAFVHQLAQKYNVQCYSIKFDTQKYAENKGLSIQMAARELRYQWFQELINIYSFNYLLTAHHLDDSIETIFINLLRGTGLNGLLGIEPKSNHIVRPLLPFTKEQIIQYAQQHQLPYREDASNNEDKYQRNYLRHNILPKLKTIQPQLYSVFQNTISHLNETHNYIHYHISKDLENCIQQNDFTISLNIHQLLQIPNLQFILKEYLRPFGFHHSQITSIIQHLSLSTTSGKYFESEKYVLLLDRKFIYIYLKEKLQSLNKSEYIAHDSDELNLFSHQYKFEFIDNKDTINYDLKNVSYLSAENIEFPLILRHRRDGDKFQLLGTSYQKKVSDIFIDKKVPLILKDAIWFLCNKKGDIMWISHLNLVNEKYKVTQQSQRILKISTSE